jgi:SAM-dependent methyltransferase
MDEAKKTNEIRGENFIKKYLSGKVIDIGSGDDLVCTWAEGFDREDGDANHITKFREINSYDAVHSSHCLEHMHNPERALLEWWKLIKPGGYLVLVVPDEDLYEQGFWPSRFNDDHKATFTLKAEKSWSPVSYNISNLVSALPNCKLISIETHDRFYDYKLQSKYPPLRNYRKTPLLDKTFLRRKIVLVSRKKSIYIT